MQLALLRYDLHVSWVPGKEMFIPDALSRAMLRDEPPNTDDEQEVLSIINQLPITDDKM